MLKLDSIVLPLAIWRKSYFSHLCPKYASQTVFSCSKCKNFPALGRGTPHLLASLPRSSTRRLLSETWQYISRGARLLGSLANHHDDDECIWNGMLNVSVLSAYSYTVECRWKSLEIRGMWASAHLQLFQNDLGHTSRYCHPPRMGHATFLWSSYRHHRKW